MKLVESKTRDPDLTKITEAIQVLSKGLERASQSELELGFKTRQFEKAQQSYSELQQKYDVLKSKNEDLELQNKNLRCKIDELKFKQSTV